MKEKAFFSYENDNVSVSADHFVVNNNIFNIKNIEYVNIGFVKSSIGFYMLFLLVGVLFIASSKFSFVGFGIILDYYNVFGWFLIFFSLFFCIKNKDNGKYFIVLKRFEIKEEVVLDSKNRDFIKNVFYSLSESIKSNSQ